MDMKRNDWLQLGVVLIAFGYVGTGLFVNAGNSCDTKVELIVAGNYSEIPPLTNGTIVAVQYECIKFCTDELSGSYTTLNQCWEQCFKLGK